MKRFVAILTFGLLSGGIFTLGTGLIQPNAYKRKASIGSSSSCRSSFQSKHNTRSPTPNTTRLLQELRNGERPPSRRTLVPEILAEALGTFLIVQIGTGAVMSAIYTQSLTSLISIASVWAVAVTLAIYCTSSISGAHLNPAITIALAMLRNFRWVKVLPYVLAQLLGAILGSMINYILYQSHIRAFEASKGLVRTSAVASASAFGEYFSCSPVVALLAETMGTFVLATVIFALTHHHNKDSRHVPVWIGLTVAANICVIAPITQAGFNPARDFGPRIVAYLFGWKQVAFRGAWVYILGPILGAVSAGFFVDRILFRSPVIAKD